MAQEDTSNSPRLTCPSCSFENIEGAQYCVRCRLHFRPLSIGLVRTRDHFYWIFRRANAGFFTGVVAWFFIPALSRVISEHFGAAFHFGLQGLLGGAFLGTVDGMIEESTPKTIRGGILGGLGGAIGGTVFGYYSGMLSPDGTDWGLFSFWAFAGLMIGLVSSMWERRPFKIMAGALGGLIGGGSGGALGYAVYAYLTDEFKPEGWLVRRLFEGFSGGIIGITLWFFIALAERFIIFKRRPVEGKSYKHCDSCQAHSPLSSWYCATCGSVLQQAASAASLHLSPYSTLDRLRETFRFLGRLAGVTGVIAAGVIFVVFLPIHKMLAFVALVLVAAVSYAFLILFSAVSESIQIALKK